MIEVNGNFILTPIYQILLDLQAELKYSGSHLLHTIKPPHSFGDIIVSCPVHNHGKEQHPSASITTVEKHKGDKVVPAGFMYCFSCKSKMSIDNLISFCFGKNDKGEYGRKWLLDHYANFEVEERGQYFNRLKEQNNKEQQYVSEEELEKYRYIHPYMYKRGLTDELIERYDIGYDKEFRLNEKTKPFECITFPIKDTHGNVLFIARRGIKHKVFHIDCDNKPLCYLYETKKYFPNSKELYICESLFNALTLIKLNKPSIALLGTGSSEQIMQLQNLDYKHYILCLDNDNAGLSATKKIIDKIKYTHLVSVFILDKKNVDINDFCFIDSFDNLLKYGKLYTINEFYNKVDDDK